MYDIIIYKKLPVSFKVEPFFRMNTSYSTLDECLNEILETYSGDGNKIAFPCLIKDVSKTLKVLNKSITESVKIEKNYKFISDCCDAETTNYDNNSTVKTFDEFLNESTTYEKINKEDVLTELSIEFLKREIESCENKLNDEVKLKHSIKYEKTQLNKSLKADFDKFIEILQKIVDKFYWNKYEVNTYESFTLDNFEFVLEKNKNTLNSLKKLMKFCEI